MRLSGEKPCIPRKTLPGKGLSQETHMQGNIQVIKQHVLSLDQVLRKSWSGLTTFWTSNQ
jgi:hypothetical protein